MSRRSDRDLHTTVRTGISSRRKLLERRRVCLASFERLEDRTLLAGGISTGQASAINQGFSALSGLGAHLNSFRQLGQNLNVLNASLGQVLNIGKALADDLATPASTYLGRANPTASGLAAALSSSAVGNTIAVTGSSDGAGILTFQVSLDVIRSANGLMLDLGPQALALGVTTTASVDLSVEMTANFTFTVSSDSASPADSFQFAFANSKPLSVAGTASTNSLTGGIDVGFLGAWIKSGTVNLHAQADAVVTASQPLGVAALLTSDPSTLLTLTPTSSFTASLPVSAKLGSSSPSGQITVTDVNLFSDYTVTPPAVLATPSVTFDAEFAKNLANFANLNAAHVLGNLNNLASFLSQFSNSSVLSTPLPFAKGRTIGSALDLGSALTQALGLGTDPNKVSPTSFLEKVVSDPNGEVGRVLAPSFATVQDLVADLAKALNVSQDDIDVRFDPTSQDLTFAVDFSFNLPEAKLPLEFSLNLAPLGDLASSDNLTVDASGHVAFAFGFNLTAAKLVELRTPSNQDQPLPSSLSDDAHFQLSIDGGPLSNVVAVLHSGISSPQAIVDHINDGLANAGITNVKAVLAKGGMVPNSKPPQYYPVIALQATTTAIHSLELFASSGDPVVTKLGFQSAVASHAHAGDVFIQNASFSGTATLADHNFSASASLGPVSIHTSGGSISGSAGFTVSLNDPETNSTTIPLADLLSAISGTISSTFASPKITGGVTLTAPHITVDAGLLAIAGSPSITASVTNLGGGAPSVTVTQNSDLRNSSLFRFESLSFHDIFQDVTGALDHVETLLGDYAQLAFMTTPLPVLNTSLAGLIDYAGSLRDDLAKIQEDPDGTLQELTSELSAALGIDSNGPIVLSYDPAADALRLDLNVMFSDSRSLPLNLNLGALAKLASGSPPVGGVGNMLGAASSGDLVVKADVSAHLSFGFDLANHFAPFLDSSPGHTTAITVGANINTPGGVSLSLNVGPIALGVEHGNITLNDGSSDPEAEATLGLGLAAGKHPLTALTAGDFRATLKGGVSLGLPLFLEPAHVPLGGDGKNTLSVTIPDLSAFLSGRPNSVQIATPDLTNLFGNLSVLGLLQNPSLFVNGIEGVLVQLQAALDSQVFSVDLPLLGGDLSQAADFLTQLVSRADDALQKLGNVLQQDLPENLIPDLQKGIFDIFGPTGLCILKNPDGSPASSASAVMISFYDASGHSLGSNPAAPSKEDAIQVNVNLGGDLVHSSIALDSHLGLPGLGISASGSVQVDLPWNFEFGVGFSVHDGVYVDTSQTAFDVRLVVTTPNLDLNGQLGFLSITAVDGSAQGKTSFTGEFKVDLLNPNNDGADRLPLTNLLSGSDFSQIVSATFAASAGVHIHLTTGFGDAAFPSLQSDLDIIWTFTTANGLSGGSQPDVAFNNVELDLGSFINNFATPIVKELNNIITPVRPVFDLLTARIPLISDLAGQDVSLLTLAAEFGDVSPEDVDDFTKVYHFITKIIDDLPTNVDRLQISLGSFDLDSYDLRTIPTSPLQPQDVRTPTQSLQDQVGGSAGRRFVDDLSSDGTYFDSKGFGISFPLLTKPEAAFGLLLGHTADLVDVKLPSISGGFSYTQEFPIYPPLFAFLSGGVNFSVQASFGYDTTGLQEYARDHNPRDLLDGFFIDTSQPFLVTQGQISAGAEVDLAIVSAGVSGGIVATANFSFKDPDGTHKLRLNEIDQLTENGASPACLFTVTGNLSFQLSAFFDINLFLFHVHKSFTIVTVDLADFSASCPAKPVLATPIGGGVLRLNMGPHAGDRLVGDVSDDNENFVITHVGGTVGDETVDVIYDGQTQEFSHVSKIAGDGGVGSNSITIGSGVLSEADLTISHVSGSDSIVDDGSGLLFVDGGAGDNSISHGGPGAAVLNVFGDYDFNLTNGLLTFGPGGFGVGTDRFSGVGTINLTGGGSNTFDVAGFGGNALLTGGSGVNRYNIADTGLGSSILIYDSGNPSSVATVNGFASSDTITNSRVTDGKDTVSYDGNLHNLILNGAAADDTFQIVSTIAGTTTVNTGDGDDIVNVQTTQGATNVNLGAGTDVVNVGSLAPGLSGGTLGGVAGVLTVAGGGGLDTLNADDTGDRTIGQSGALTESSLTGLGMGPQGIVYRRITALNIDLGTGGNRFVINVSSGKDLPATTTIDGGPSTDDHLDATWAGDFNGVLNLFAFEFSTIRIADDFNGTLSDTLPGDAQLITVGGSITRGGSLLAGSIGTITVGKDVAGTVHSLSFIRTLTVGTTSYPGSVLATGVVTADQDIITGLIYGDVAGIVQAGATIHSLTVDGSVIPTPVAPSSGAIAAGIIRAADILILTVGGAMAGLVDVSSDLDVASVGQDLSGLVNVGQALGQLIVGGGTPGSVVAETIGTIGVYGGYGAVVAQIKERGVQRRIEAAVPSTPYPQPIPLYSYPTSSALASPSNVDFRYFYEGLGSNNGMLSNPQSTIRVTNGSGDTAPDQYDLSLVTWSDAARFNLARLDASGVNLGVTGIRNVAIEGDLLPSVTPGAAAFFGLPSAEGGVRLPYDNLAGVEVRDNAQAGEVTVASIQGVAFGSLTDGRTTLTGAESNALYASELLVRGTKIVQTGTTTPQHLETFRIPVDSQPDQHVAFFQKDTFLGYFDDDPIVFADQDQGVSTGDPRGTVTALVSVNGPSGPRTALSVIQTIALAGDGGSFSTTALIAKQVTSTGPLGDVDFLSPQGIQADVTAPSIFGYVWSSGAITGTIQTTGIWTNMTTGQSSMIAADFGSTIVNSKGDIIGVSTVTAWVGGIAGRLISRGNLISHIRSNGELGGIVAAQGDLGVIQEDSTGNFVRYGGIVSYGSISGQIVTLGNILGDVTINGDLTGRIAANGRPSSVVPGEGILGDIKVGGYFGNPWVSAAVISGGEIGDAALGTALSIWSWDKNFSIIAAEGPIRLINASYPWPPYIFSDVPDVPGDPNASAVDAVFETQDGALITSFDDDPLDLVNLELILTDLARLHIVKNNSGQYVLSDS
jgi:hypothetical protein